MRFFSPAKVNLFFRVLRKRDDGYHDIASLYQAIDLCDTLYIQLSHQDHLFCDHPSLRTDDSNLVLKAVQLFRKKTGLSFHVKIELYKLIPLEAGLGGGSSNAATTLWALNCLTGYPVSTSDLASWSGELGSDVPFFFSQGTAYCTGKGDLFKSLANLSFLSGKKLWIAKPSYGLSTPSVYKACDLSLFPSRDPEMILTDFMEGRPQYFNDLEFPAFSLKPELKILRQTLLSLGFLSVTLTGSGTAFFCLGPLTLKPRLDDIEFYETKPLSRDEGHWYKTIAV